MAVWRCKPRASVVVHSVQGSQYGSNYGICEGIPSDCPAPTVNGLNSITLAFQALDANGSRTQISAGVYPIIPGNPNDAATNPNMPNQKWAQGDFTGFSAHPQQVAQDNVTIDSVTLGNPVGYGGDAISGMLDVTLPDGTSFSLPLDSNTLCYVTPQLKP